MNFKEIDMEPSDAELIELENTEVEFTDSLVYLEIGAVLISRIVNNIEDSEGMLVMYKPYQLLQNHDGTLLMCDWMPESADDYIMIPVERVVTIATPKDAVLDGYHSSIGITKEAFVPEGTLLH